MQELYRTEWTSKFRKSKSADQFVFNSFLYFALKFRPHHLFVARRNPKSVEKTYDQERSALMGKLASTSWDDYVYFGESKRDFILVNDQVKWGAWREPRERLLTRISEAVKTYSKPGSTIVEFGSGDGRNLLALKKQFPDRKFIGLELSPLSVEVSKAAAKKFGVDGVEFFASNVCEPLPVALNPQDVSLAYSSFALEMMPRIFTHAVDNMLSSSGNAVVFFEPVDECWPWHIRGITSRLRVIVMDRLRGLRSKVEKVCKGGDWKLQKIERAGTAINPLNEMVEIHVVRTAPIAT